MKRKFMRAIKLSVLTLYLTACTGIKTPVFEHWVKPYEKSALEDPSMARAEDPILDQLQRNAHNRTEGARFKQFSIGEGCAC